ncbi:MAG: hydantoinase/oxoprolinase family protein, partial [Candidatus Hodarchaeota archaeon]
VVVDSETGESLITKAPTTPHDLSIGVMDAIGEAARLLTISRKTLLEQTLMLKHGTTVGTNAVITRRGAKVGFITTKGFEDTTLIGRAIQRVDGLSDEEVRKMLLITKPEPLVPKSRLKGVYERIDFKGNVVVPLNIEDAREQIRALVEGEKVEAIGVSLLFSFVNPVHERKIKELIYEIYPNHDLFLTFSHELLPLKREYARANTVILNCYIGKVMETYLANLNKKLQDEGFKGKLLVMQANGGLLGWERVPPAKTLSSGPSGGVIATQYMASLLGHANVTSADMGGTSFDVSFIRDGRWGYERDPIISRWRISLPMIKVDSIGAGGGTIARLGPEPRRLLVGPDSAGAIPGPVCYDSGGTEPTVCDADLILGFLNPDYFLGGRIKLNKEKAEHALQEKIAIPLEIDVIEAARGIFNIVNAHMANLTRVITMRAGLSPEDFVLYAFGGTGPMHAAFFARELGIRKVYVFPNSAVFSAFGIVGADIIRTSSFSLGYRMPIAPKILDSKIKEAEDALAQDMEKEGFSREDLEFRHVFNMRWLRQVLYHSLPLPAKKYESEKDVSWLIESWAKDFEKVYGKGVAYTRAGIELVSMDIDVIGKTMKPTFRRYPEGKGDPSAAFKGYREVFGLEGTKEFMKTSIYEYDRLQSGNTIRGPAIVESPTTTIVIPPDKLGRVDSFLNIALEL